MIRRVIASLAVVAAAATGVVMSTALPASASASGCTAAPGNLFAHNCIFVTGKSLTVTNARSAYYVGAPPTNVCRVTAQFTYVPLGARRYAVKAIGTTKCGVAAAWIDWKPAFRLADRTRLCAQQRNDHTGGRFTNNACINIHK